MSAIPSAHHGGCEFVAWGTLTPNQSVGQTPEGRAKGRTKRRTPAVRRRACQNAGKRAENAGPNAERRTLFGVKVPLASLCERFPPSHRAVFQPLQQPPLFRGTGASPPPSLPGGGTGRGAGGAPSLPQPPPASASLRQPPPAGGWGGRGEEALAEALAPAVVGAAPALSAVAPQAVARLVSRCVCVCVDPPPQGFPRPRGALPLARPRRWAGRGGRR